MYKYKFLQAGQLPREHVFLAKSAEFFYHIIFETSRWRPEAFEWINVVPVASIIGDIKIYQCHVIKR